MASADVCDPCLESNKTVHAEKYCSECEEKLCAECTESHRRFKAFKSHDVIDLSSIGARIQPSSKINCEIHTDVQIDYFCSQHDVVCCRACIPDSHSSCKTVIPLDFASKDVKNSSLLSDTLKELDNMTKTLQKIAGNRDDNKKLLEQKKSLIIKQISAVKSKLLKHLDDIEKRLITEVASVQEKNEEKIKKEKDEISELTSVLKENKQELEFLKHQGSNNQIFLALRKQIINAQKTDNKIHDMTSAINEIDMEFDEIKNFNIETIGSLSQITRPCPIKYKSMKVQHPQVQQDRRQTLTEFIKEGEVNLKHGEKYSLADMAVTSDNKLLLCNYKSSHPKVYIYKEYKTYENEISFTSRPWCITVVPCTDKAVVTLPDEKSIQFINTSNNTKVKKINIGEWCGSVTAVKDKIYIGGYSQVLILNTNGSRVREITTGGGYNFNLLYNERNDQLLLRQMGRLCCINLDGHVIYRKDISGNDGLAVDQQGHVYICGENSNDIQRLSPDGTFRDIVLSEHDGVDRPWGIAFNNDFTKLLIINRDKTVLVYSCK
jgi:DNA-binding FrmR family transcriptional regulator